MISMFSGLREAAGDEADASDHEPGFGTCGGGLEVLGETAAASEPGEGALDHPALGFGLEGAEALGSGDDLDRPRAAVGDGVN